MSLVTAANRSRDWLYPPRARDQVVLVSGDERYLGSYLGGLAASVLLAGMRLHVNAVGPGPVTARFLERLVRRFPLAVSVSIESVDLDGEEARTYYAASRFLCARELVERYRCDVYLLDIDSIVLRPFCFPEADYGLFLRDSDDPRFQVAAGAAFAAPGGLAFLEAFAERFMASRPWTWFDDQRCLAWAHAQLSSSGLRAVRLTNRLLSFEAHPEAAVWSAKGASKTDDVTFVQTSSRLSMILAGSVGCTLEGPSIQAVRPIAERNLAALERRRELIEEGLLPLGLKALLRLPPFVGFAEVRLSDSVRFEMLLCDRDDGVALRAFWNGGHEPATSRIIAALSRGARCIVDVGAHTGYFSMLAARSNPEALVLAVEPMPLNCARLMTNVRANGLSNVRLAACAASDRAGTVTLVSEAPRDYHSTGGRVMRDGTVGESVRAARLDDLVDPAPGGVDLVKCDAEGHEASVLVGARRILENDRPDLILECNPSGEPSGVEDVLRDLGYRYFVIDEAANCLERAAGFVAESGPGGEARRNRLATTRADDALHAALADAVVFA